MTEHSPAGPSVDPASLDPQEVHAARDSLIAVARRAFETGLQTNAGGNLSVRLRSVPACVIKPSGIGYGEVNHDNLMVCDLDGRTVVGHHKPSKDKDFHCAIYRARADVGAIVHVHSPWATAWGCAGRTVPLVTVQAIEKMGSIPLVPLGPNGGPQTAEQIGEVMGGDARVCLLANHGTVGVAPTALKALHLCEILEETAQTAAFAELLSQGTPLALPGRGGVDPYTGQRALAGGQSGGQSGGKPG